MTQKDLELIIADINVEYRKQQHQATKEFYDRRDSVMAEAEQARKEHIEKFESNMSRQKELEAELAEKRRYGIASYSVEFQTIKQQLDEVGASNMELKEQRRERESALKATLRELHRDYEDGCIKRRIHFAEKKNEATRRYNEEKAQAEVNA